MKRKKARRSTSMALVRRSVPIRRVKAQALTVTASPIVPVLTSDPMMAATFVGTLKLDETQILALRRPVADGEVEWKPAVKDGPAILAYLGHNGYRDRLDAAFGLGGWGMVPVGQPKQVDGVVYVPYALVIGGVPRVYAWGEQEQHKMSYGDALEGAKSSAIVRCGKELGIARELWNRQHVAQLKARRETVAADGRTRASAPARHDTYHAHEAEAITQKQRQRLWVILRNSGRSEGELRVWLEQVYRLTSTKDIARRDYEDICEAIERPGLLPLPEEEAREPGQEG